MSCNVFLEYLCPMRILCLLNEKTIKITQVSPKIKNLEVVKHLEAGYLMTILNSRLNKNKNLKISNIDLKALSIKDKTFPLLDLSKSMIYLIDFHMIIYVNGL